MAAAVAAVVVVVVVLVGHGMPFAHFYYCMSKSIENCLLLH